MGNVQKKSNTLIQNQFLNWQKKNFRDFPWRHTRDPYKLMIAEFMLHRTRAEQVVPIYNAFIKKYPDVQTLARAKGKEIKKVTKHLGLHWRSAHFIKAAEFITKTFKSKIPDTSEELFKIPGIGEYVAGAMLTVCFNKKYPVVDSNIARFTNRFFGLNLAGEIRRKKEIIDVAGKLFNVSSPGKLLFAIIDFTTLICKPRNPDHEACVFKRKCLYMKGGLGKGESSKKLPHKLTKSRLSFNL